MNEKLDEKVLLIRRWAWAKGYEKEQLFHIGKELQLAYFDKYTADPWDKENTYYGDPDEHAAALELAKRLTDDELARLFAESKLIHDVVFYGQFYT